MPMARPLVPSQSCQSQDDSQARKEPRSNELEVRLDEGRRPNVTGFGTTQGQSRPTKEPRTAKPVLADFFG
ncbi:unnamed protein product [Caenorhabditis brenneri]